MYSVTPDFLARILTPPEKYLPVNSATSHQNA